jgi:hypothetical protein
MTNPATLLALADRCEQAAGPDAGLDLAIWKALSEMPGFKHPSPIWRFDVTASLDAAVTTVPEGHEWLRTNPPCMTVYRVPADLKEWAQHIYGRGVKPELALCAAALRAWAAAYE